MARPRPLLGAAALLAAALAGCRPPEPLDKMTAADNAFYAAVMKNDAAAVEAMIRKGFPVNKRLTVQAPQGGMRHPTPIMLAAMTGELGMVKAIAALGADLQARDEKGRNALFWAQFGKNKAQIVALAAFLADAGLGVDVPANDGLTPLMVAAAADNTEFVRYLVGRGADPNRQASDGASPLFYAIKVGNLDMTRVLVEHKADVNLRAADGSTPLLALTSIETPSAKDKDIGLLLLEHGAYANVTDKLGMSPLLNAVEKNQSELALALLRFRADPNLAEKGHGLTPLMACVITKNHDLAKALLAAGADPNAATRKDKTTALMMAREQKDSQMAAILGGR